MGKLEQGIKKIAGFLNELAGWGVVAAMVLVVMNIILREVFGAPILGTYEFTGFLTAVLIGLSIAYCAVLDSHIAIDFIMEKLKKRVRHAIGIITGILMSCFMVYFTARLFIYAGQVAGCGEVSPTTRTPLYFFVYVVAIGFAALCLVLLLKVKDDCKGVMKK